MQNDFDQLVPDPQVRKELGDVTAMTFWRWDRSPAMAARGWPPAVKIQNRKFRSRKQLEVFKANLLQAAVATAAEVQAI